MLNYEEFKQYVVEHIMEKLPADMQHLKPEVMETEKTNKVLDGLVLREEVLSGAVASPTIYLNQLYESYKRGVRLDGVLSAATAAFVEAQHYCKNIIKQTEFAIDNYKERVTCKLINYEQNKDLLSDMPHRRFHDLAVTYCLELFSNRKNYSSTAITNSLQDRLKLTEEELFQLAKENTRKFNPPRVKSMYEMLLNLAGGTNLEILPEMSLVDTMFVITTTNGMNGAASMLYDDLLHDLAEKLGTDLYILPSSIHELIAIPDNGSMSLEYMADMVHEVNTTQVELSEQLSNQVYHYDRTTRELIQATDSPYKRLDGQDESINVAPKRRGR